MSKTYLPSTVLLIRIVTLRKPGLKVGLRKQKIFSEVLPSVVLQPAKQTLEVRINALFQVRCA